LRVHFTTLTLVSLAIPNQSFARGCQASSLPVLTTSGFLATLSSLRVDCANGLATFCWSERAILAIPPSYVRRNSWKLSPFRFRVITRLMDLPSALKPFTYASDRLPVAIKSNLVFDIHARKINSFPSRREPLSSVTYPSGGCNRIAKVDVQRGVQKLGILAALG
jgi:hypothetical protein